MNTKHKTLKKQIIIEHYIRSEEAKKMLTIYEAMVIQILASYIGDGRANNNLCWEDQDELARSCYMSSPQLRRVIKSLKDKKIINVKRKQYKNYYSFNEFWFDEVIKYSSHLDAVKAFIANSDRSNRSPDRSNRSISLIYNNKNNNSVENQSNSYIEGGHPNGKMTERLKSILGH